MVNNESPVSASQREVEQPAAPASDGGEQPVPVQPGALEQAEQPVPEDLSPVTGSGLSPGETPPEKEQQQPVGPVSGMQEDKPPLSQHDHDYDRVKQQVNREIAAAASSGSVPNCPRCAVPMVLRTSKRGIEFYHCPNFPSCREVRGLYE